ncbi:hypothetical protein QM012_001964 [Aureobasidium pullulans]|uniref:Integral membrane protein n=1 Tax=Aureobasidium pullulans TaxID=5580 RepID=A0ABR0TD12_AURPU
MPNPHTTTAFESLIPLLKDILGSLAITFMLCFINALATTNVYAISSCSIALLLASSIGCAYTYDILVVNTSFWPVVLWIINLVASASIIAQEIWFIHKAYKQIFYAEKPRSGNLLLNLE